MVAAFMSKSVDKFVAITKPKTMVSINILLILSFFILGSINHYLAVFAILFQQMARGLYKPVLNKYVNKHTESDNRATVLSVISLITNLAAALALPIAGLMIDNMDVFQVHLIYGVALTIFTIALNIFLNKTLGKKRAVNTNEKEYLKSNV